MAEGVYSNSRLMHYVTSLVGCIVQVRVRNGNLYEGIFRSFSPQLDLVLEMTHKVDQNVAPIKGVGPAVSNLLVSFPFEGGINEKLIFRFKDVVMLEATNVDLDYAIKDSFTDTAISKFNGQITEKQLEPWEGPFDDVDSCSSLIVDDDDGSNGWDANEMFKMNAEKYGVKSSYDNTLQEYTVPLERKNTEEYKLQEAKASRIAQEIEANATYQSRIQLENGDEEDRFSAVVRPDGANSRYIPPQRRRSVPGPKRPMPNVSSSPVHSAGPKHYPPSQQVPSASNSAPNQATKVTHPASSLPLPAKQTHNPPPPPPCLPTLSQPVSPCLSSVPVTVPSPTSENTDKFSNGEGDEDEIKPVVASSTTEIVTPIPPTTAVKVTVPSPVLQPLPPRPERRREIERKPSKKVRDDEIEEFKKFSSNFKLSEENKDCKEQEDILPNSETNVEQSVLTKTADLKVNDSIKEEEEESASNIVKTSTLNPNAKEFVFNPNAKSFTPRSVAVASPQAHVPLQPPRMHTQSPVMAISHTQMVPQPIFAAMGPPQYVMQATPVSMALTSQFASATLSQAPRYRKGPIMQQRHDISPQVHAATGQPILAPAAIPAPSQITMQYTPPPGMIPAPGPPQQTLTYPPMYSVVGPRVMSPQPVGMVPTSHTATYCESPHMPTHYFMSAHPNAAALSAVSAAHSMQQGAQHSNPHPPQSHTPVVHPSPSPVHQPPPPHGNPSQTPTTVMYPGAAVNQHALQTGHPNHSQNHLVSHPHPTNFAGGPQPVVLMPQQGVPGAHSHHHHPGSLPSGPHPLHLHTIHSQNTGNHVGTPTLLPQMTVIPTSAAMVSAPTAMATSPFVPHPQGV